MITKLKQFNEVVDELSKSEVIAFDFETIGSYPGLKNDEANLHHKTLQIEGLALRSEKLEPVYIPFIDTEVSKIYLIEKLGKVFGQESTLADYFLGARPKNKFCTLVGYWYIDENARKDKVSLGKELFGMNTISYKEAKKLGNDSFLDYALRDAEFAYQMYFYCKVKLPDKLWNLASGLEMDFVDVLIDMCLYGTTIDINNLKEGEKLLTDKALELQAQIYNELGEFNLKSPAQLCEKIYGITIKRSKKEGVTLTKLPGKYPKVVKWNNKDDPIKRTPSTDEKALSMLDTPAANLIKEYRGVVKLLDTYAIGYQKWIIDGKVYPTFNHVGTVTGRLSSDKPNMQNIPREPSYGWWLRDAIHAADGYDLVVADESQLEIRILAHFCKDTALMKAIFSGEDIHLATAKIIYDKDDVTKQERTFAKTMNFGIIYGLGIPAIAEALKISVT